jgi:hypothetical protein
MQSVSATFVTIGEIRKGLITDECLPRASPLLIFVVVKDQTQALAHRKRAQSYTLLFTPSLLPVTVCVRAHKRYWYPSNRFGSLFLSHVW